jgi:hypothetical protein
MRFRDPPFDGNVPNNRSIERLAQGTNASHLGPVQPPDGENATGTLQCLKKAKEDDEARFVALRRVRHSLGAG